MRGAGETFAQGLDDGDGRADSGLEIERATVLFGGPGQPHSVPGDQRLVGRHHRLAGFQGGLDRRQRRFAGTAHQLDQAIDAGIAGEFEGVFGPADAAQIEVAFFRLRARGNGDHPDAAAAAGRQGAALLLDQANDFGANGAEPRDAHFQGCDHDERNLPEIR